MERRDGESKTGRQRLVEEMGMVMKWKGKEVDKEKKQGKSGLVKVKQN